MQRVLLAIDGGQSGVRAHVIEASALDDGAGADGIPAPTPESLFEFPGLITDLPVAEQVADVVHRVAGSLADRSDDVVITEVSAGLSGITDSQRAAEIILSGVRDLGVTSVHVGHDSISSYLGALGDAQGAVVASGTGVVTLAVGPAEVARIDGWGYSMGDAGSGFWIGSKALDAVMRAYDGRGPETALTGVVTADLGELEHAYIVLQGDESRVARTARFAAEVARLSESDEVAGRILDEAAAELAHSVATGLRRVGLGDAESPSVCFLGGVLRGDRVRAGVTRLLTEAWPGIQVLEPLGTGLTGAALLSTVAADSALHPHVGVAQA